MELKKTRDPRQRSLLRFSQRGGGPATPARLAATPDYRSFRPTDNQTGPPGNRKRSKIPALRDERTVAKSAGFQRPPVAVSPVPDDTFPEPPDPSLPLLRLLPKYQPPPPPNLIQHTSHSTNLSS